MDYIINGNTCHDIVHILYARAFYSIAGIYVCTLMFKLKQTIAISNNYNYIYVNKNSITNAYVKCEKALPNSLTPSDR